MPPETGGMTEGGGAPQGAPPPAPPSAPQQVARPTGQTGATMPVSNQGIEAAAMAKLGLVAQMMQMTLAVLPVGGDVARDVRQALDKIAKHVPPGGMNRGVEMSELQKMQLQQRQMGPQIAAMRAAQAGGAGGGMPAAT